MPTAKSLLDHCLDRSFVARKHHRLLETDNELLFHELLECDEHSSRDELGAMYTQLKEVVLIRAYRAARTERERRAIAVDFERLVRGDHSGFHDRFPSLGAYGADWKPGVGIGVSLYDRTGRVLFDEPPSVTAS